jgi:hypothetical protein
VIAKDAEHEAVLRASHALLPPKPADPVFSFGDECATLMKRDLTPTERQFCNDIETAAHKSYEAGNAPFVPPDPDSEPDEVIEIPAPAAATTGVLPVMSESAPANETKQYADGSSATGPGPLPDVSPEGAPAVPVGTEPKGDEPPVVTSTV